MIFSSTRIDRIKAFEHSLKPSLFSVNKGVLNPGCILAAVFFSLLEISIQKVVYFAVVPGNFSPLYVFSVFTVPLAVAMLFGTVPAFTAGMIASLLIAVFSKCSLWVFITAATGSAIAAMTAPKINSGIMLARAFLITFLFQTLFACAALYQCFGNEMLKGQTRTEFFVQLLVFMVFFAVWAVIFPFVHLLLTEKILKIASNITISKFANLENPLLKKLSLDAPGTYHHSISVGDLAKHAAETIGANALLARVGAYYHDIGKILKPDYYMENQTGKANPHDEFPPNISRLIIMNHVRNGYCLAESRNIPVPILRFIATHHGTSVISWFYRKALQQVSNGAAGTADKTGTENKEDLKTGLARIRDIPPEESHFRYDGALPRTKEETIVSLADSIEAASRSLVSPTEESLAKLVDNIIKIKFEDGQLAESELTAAEFMKIKTAFTESLRHLLHARLAYPPKNDKDKH